MSGETLGYGEALAWLYGFSDTERTGKFTGGGSYGLDLNTRALCGAMSGALVEVCNGGDTAKHAVASKVHQIVCEYGPARYGIAGGVFRSSINTLPATLDTHFNAMLGVIRKSL